eukprot:3197154-Prymnesium_polylepis.1
MPAHASTYRNMHPRRQSCLSSAHTPKRPQRRTRPGRNWHQGAHKPRVSVPSCTRHRAHRRDKSVAAAVGVPGIGGAVARAGAHRQARVYDASPAVHLLAQILLLWRQLVEQRAVLKKHV